MTQRELIHGMVGLLSAGIDTVTTTTSIVLNILAIYPDVQEKVFSEIKSVLGCCTTTIPTYDQIKNLDFLTRVIKETLRLFPPGSLVGRKNLQEFKIGDYTIPADCTLAVFIHSIHRNPQHWPNPDSFDPDRFLPSVRRNPNAYLPFSSGPRNCLGHKYAMLQMKITLSSLLKKYRVLPGDHCKSIEDIRCQLGFTLKLLPGNDIRLELRDLSQSSKDLIFI
ncbi:hypothetical protein WDU94_010551 [Cyamophila willieti]